jgi:alanine dehydrogenase
VPLYVSEAEVAELLTPAEALAAVEASLARLARGEVDNPPRVTLPIPGGQFAVMPCVDRGLGYAGLKTYAWTRGSSPFLVVLISLAPPAVAAIVEAGALGELRTAAASAVAVQRLAGRGAATLGVIGCGRQAASHVAALRSAVPRLERVIAYCRTAKSLAAFCAEHDCEPAGSAREAAACDVVVTATTSTEPVLRGAWLSDGACVCGVGGNGLSARELDDFTLERAAFVCTDSRAQAMNEAGDISGPVARGVLAESDVHELQDVVGGELRGRRSDGDVVLFKSNGLAAWDVALAARVAELAAMR